MVICIQILLNIADNLLDGETVHQIVMNKLRALRVNPIQDQQTAIGKRFFLHQSLDLFLQTPHRLTPPFLHIHSSLAHRAQYMIQLSKGLSIDNAHHNDKPYDCTGFHQKRVIEYGVRYSHQDKDTETSYRLSL